MFEKKALSNKFLKIVQHFLAQEAGFWQYWGYTLDQGLTLLFFQWIFINFPVPCYKNEL